MDRSEDTEVEERLHRRFDLGGRVFRSRADIDGAEEWPADGLEVGPGEDATQLSYSAAVSTDGASAVAWSMEPDADWPPPAEPAARATTRTIGW